LLWPPESQAAFIEETPQGSAATPLSPARQLYR
jgi:hypothetical protein